MTASPFPPLLYIAFCAAAATIFGLNAVSVATPSLAYTLNADIGDISTATTMYLLAEILFMCSIPAWLRLFSPRELLKYGCIGFALSSVACFASASLDMLIISRTLQGAFGGLLLPLPLLFVQRYLTKDQQYEGMNRYGMSTVILPVLAPLITLSLPPEHVQWVFLIIATLALPGALLKIDSTERPAREHLEKANILSFAVFVMGIGAVVWAIEHAQEWGGMQSLTFKSVMLLGVTLSSCGIVWQTRYPRPLFEWRVFCHLRSALVMFMTFLLGCIVYGLIYLIPLYAVMVHQAPPSVVFYIVAAAAIPQVLMYPLLSRFKHYLIPHLSVAAGFFLLSLMAMYFSTAGIDFGPGEMWQIQLMRAVGILILVLPFNAMLLSATPQGLETGMGVQYNFIRTLGGAMSIATANAYVVQRTATYQQDTQSYTDHEPFSGYASALAFNDAFTVLAALLLTAGVISLALKRSS